jgi:Tol biopolymer transport system component
MGEVYRARDTRLGREVALKVLPAAMAFDPGRRTRFEQEARAAAALNHPNIVGLHDVGETEGVFYIVSELVPGEPLAALLERGPLPNKKLLDLAVQIADGMAAAHAARITHRDLKPANIMVTPEGRAKILDFGLAKQAAPAASSPDATVTVQQTEPGMIMGTVAYMSPEQARGRPADHRSDQFSFGLILYEMAAGRKAFEKPEAVQILSAILSEEPAPIERAIPEPLRWAIDRCLAKEPADRYESSRDLFHDLRHIRDHLAETTVSQPVAAMVAAAPRRRVRWVMPAAVLFGLAAAFAAGLYFAGPKFPDQSAYRFTPFAFDPAGQDNPVWSPDGKAVAYSGNTLTSEPEQVFVRYLDAPAAVQITRMPEGAYPLAWAPDAKRILFRTDKKPYGIRSVSVAGGEPEMFMPMDGNPPVAIAPDLHAVAFPRLGGDGTYGVWISSPPGSEARKYTPDPMATHALYNATHLRFSPDGKSILLLMRGDRSRDEAWLMPYPPDPGKPPHLVLAGLKSYGGTPHFSWMPDSRRLVLSFQASPEGSTQIWLADTASADRRALTSGTSGHQRLDVSPDGRRIVFAEAPDNYDVVAVNLEHATVRRLIASQRNEFMASWAAKEGVLAYVTERNGPHEIWLHPAAGPDRLAVSGRDFPPGTTQWFLDPVPSPDGSRLIYERFEVQGGSHLWMSSISGGTPVPVTNDTVSTEFPGSWSPDGAWFVYLAIRNGKYDLMKVKTSGQATPVLVRAATSCEPPSFSPNGDTILCGQLLISPDGQTTRSIGNHGSPTYTFSADGKLLYGLRIEGNHTWLISVDPGTGAEKRLGDLGHEFAPASGFSPAIRFNLAPDGKSFVYNVNTQLDNLWMFEGFQ